MDMSEAPSSRKVTDTIRKENPTWRIPERRVAKHLKRQLKARNSANAGVSENGDIQDEESVYSETSTSTSTRSLKNFTFFSSPLKYLSSSKRTINAPDNIPSLLDEKPKILEEVSAELSTNTESGTASPIIATEDLNENAESLGILPSELVDQLNEMEESLGQNLDDVVTEVTKNATDFTSENIGEIKDLTNGTHNPSEPKETTEHAYQDDNDGRKNNCQNCVIL